MKILKIFIQKNNYYKLILTSFILEHVYQTNQGIFICLRVKNFTMKTLN